MLFYFPKWTDEIWNLKHTHTHTYKHSIHTLMKSYAENVLTKKKNNYQQTNNQRVVLSYEKIWKIHFVWNVVGLHNLRKIKPLKSLPAGIKSWHSWYEQNNLFLSVKFLYSVSHHDNWKPAEETGQHHSQKLQKQKLA